MDLKEYIEAKRALERKLAEMISAELKAFEDLTGQSACGVSVCMQQFQKLADPAAGYFVRSVRVDAPVE